MRKGPSRGESAYHDERREVEGTRTGSIGGRVMTRALAESAQVTPLGPLPCTIRRSKLIIRFLVVIILQLGKIKVTNGRKCI